MKLHLPVPADEAAARHLALGPGLASSWTADGNPVLHGSCVGLSGRAVSFVAPPGRGKSTLAAQLHQRGHRFISDGLTLLAPLEGRLQAHPGPAWFKLDDASLRALGRRPEQHGRVHAGVEKRLWELGEAGEGEPMPLSHVYLLEDGPLTSAERLTGRRALVGVLENMYLLPFLGGTVAPELLRQAAEVARAVPVFRLRRVRGFEHASAVLAYIEEHVAAVSLHLSQIAEPPRPGHGALEEPG